ncbi:hypothetical protein PPL_01106 [Heterostelium album PN500]|uniref:Uncharacterized protein n=1 Tax=Heterostelium pallidum (strain ATCC 26659 / Pp 5 / PN500) TaxID=670386 RepID=D3AY47_HETP5|nr:hypothetical protein PPL_01106 [Heterostelium album PN500]EFA85874.1 hypothetical protein PPL_01106 [Heterostelium album PN500]|eukprot:XP_020437980.1 hypothetical protein PPL_01106 [Heterostelium album PN500]
MSAKGQNVVVVVELLLIKLLSLTIYPEMYIV